MLDRVEATGMKDTNFKSRKNAFEIFYILKRRIETAEPTSLIRLGDGEGTVLGYPELVSRKRLNSFFKIWYGNDELSEEDAKFHTQLLTQAIYSADIIGLPRAKQIRKSPNWAVVEESLLKRNLLQSSHHITDAAIHRYLTFCLQYRGLLSNLPFLGIISCRNLSKNIKDTFKISEVEQYLVRGESKFPGTHQQPHFPERFWELKKSLKVPFKGAVFLVGAGVLGKSYCQWIKERGGIAIDIGSICDAWASVPSRTKHPIHKLERYMEKPTVELEEACTRYNSLIVELGLDTAQVNPELLPNDFPISW